MTEEEMYAIALKRAGYALAMIADRQMNTWTEYPDRSTPTEIIARQILEAMGDALKGG